VAKVVAAAGVIAAESLGEAAGGWLQPDTNATESTMREQIQDSLRRDFMLLLL